MGLRAAISLYLLYRASEQLSGRAGTVDKLGATLEIAAALMLLLGFWTPLAGAMAALLIALQSLRRLPISWEVVLAAAIALSLCFLGPGSYSLDAWRYGRKRIYIDNR